MKRTLLFLIPSIIILQSCAKVFYTPDAKNLASVHKIIAIIPPKVSIFPRNPTDMKIIEEQRNTQSLNFQKEMFSWMLKRKMQGTILIDIQDVETTNAKLYAADFHGKYLLPEEFCEVLNVDGILTSNYSLSKPMSEAGAIALGVLVGVYGATNEIEVTLTLHDRSTNKAIWNFNHTLKSSFGSPSGLVDALMRQASKKMPYFTKVNTY